MDKHIKIAVIFGVVLMSVSVFYGLIIHPISIERTKVRETKIRNTCLIEAVDSVKLKRIKNAKENPGIGYIQSMIGTTISQSQYGPAFNSCLVKNGLNL